ncbi:hypothetical protein WT23_06530 [Burkholderia territorii]|nr:hypothetical protein WT23_06530 [Burkholderia territorii]
MIRWLAESSDRRGAQRRHARRFVHAGSHRMRSLSRQNGANLGEPHTWSMGNGLYEMRLKGAEGIARVFYCAIVERRIVMLHCFVKKTQKTPRKELQIARQRLKEVQDGNV